MGCMYNTTYHVPETKIFTAESHDGWETIRLPFGVRPIFRGELLGLGRIPTIANVSRICFLVYPRMVNS